MATMMQRASARTAQANSGEASFTPQDPKAHIPPEQVDAVDRVVAAGLKIMYSPQMADERQQALQSQDPIPKRLADNVTGLMLTLDQQSKGGIPEATIFPAAVILDNEAANMLVHAGQNVTQQDYNESLQILYVQLGKKLGVPDDQLMRGAQDALAKKDGGMPPDEQLADTGTPVPPQPGAPAPAAVPPQGAVPPQPMPPQGVPTP